MNTEEKRTILIRARNLLSEVFIASKDNWIDGWWCTNLSIAMGYIDQVIQTVDTPKPKNVGE